MEKPNASRKLQYQNKIMSVWRSVAKKDLPIQSEPITREKFTPQKNATRPSNSPSNPIKRLIDRNSKQFRNKDLQNGESKISNKLQNKTSTMSISPLRAKEQMLKNCKFSKKDEIQQKQIEIENQKCDLLGNSSLSKNQFKHSFDISCIDNNSMEKINNFNYQSNQSKRQIYRLLSLCSGKCSRSASIQKVQQFKLQLQLFKNQLLKQLQLIKQHSINSIMEVTKYCQIQLNNNQKLSIKNSELANLDTKYFNIKYNDFSQIFDKTTKNYEFNQMNEFSPIKSVKMEREYKSELQKKQNTKVGYKKHNRYQTDNFEFYKKDIYEINELANGQRFQCSITSNNQKCLKQLNKKSTSRLIQQTQRSKSFQKIFQTIQKLRVSVQGKDGLYNQLKDQNSLKGNIENRDEKKKAILKKNTKYLGFQMQIGNPIKDFIGKPQFF